MKMRARNMTTEFDKKLAAGTAGAPEITHAASIVTVTLELCQASAQKVFGNQATPEAALAIYDRVKAVPVQKPDKPVVDYVDFVFNLKTVPKSKVRVCFDWMQAKLKMA